MVTFNKSLLYSFSNANFPIPWLICLCCCLTFFFSSFFHFLSSQLWIVHGNNFNLNIDSEHSVLYFKWNETKCFDAEAIKIVLRIELLHYTKRYAKRMLAAGSYTFAPGAAITELPQEAPAAVVALVHPAQA